MIKQLPAAIIIIFLIPNIYAQSPKSFNYQAVLRDATGQVMANREVEIGITMLQGSASGTEIFSENHNTTTNSYGLANLKIGTMNPSVFELIDWSAGGPFFIQIEVDNVIMGTSQLSSVPFAMHAVTVENDLVEDDDADPENELQDISISGNELSISSGSTVVLPDNTEDDDADPENEIQELSLDNTNISISRGNSVDLAPVLNYSDTSSTNELQDISLSGTDLSITHGSTVDLSVLQDGTGTDNQTLKLSYDRILKISDGNSVILPYLLEEDIEEQTINISGDTVSLSNGSFAKLPTYVSDTDGDTKIQVEENPDEDILRVDIVGNETLTMSNSSGTALNLPTNDENSSLKVKNTDGDVVFGVDGRGLLNGDGSGLSNIKSLANSSGGNSMKRIDKTYAWYTNVKSVTLETPCSGKCFVMASGYVRWESKGWDLYLASILRNADPNESWDAENEFFRYLNLATDYNCADSSDQYASFAQHRCFNVGAGTQTFTLWANRYTSSAKVRMDDVNLTVLFFPTSGTGGGILKSTQLEAYDEQQEANVPFTNVPRRPDGGELRKRLDAMINNDRKPEKIPDDELIKLQKTVDELKAENESLRKEKSETDRRINDIEEQLKLLLKTKNINN